MPDFTLIQRKVRHVKEVGARLLRRAFVPSFPKAAFLATAVCAFVLTNFRTPETKPFAGKRPRVVTPLKVQPVQLRDSERVSLSDVVEKAPAPVAPLVVEAKKTANVSAPIKKAVRKVAKRSANKKRSAKRLAARTRRALKLTVLTPEAMIEAVVKAEDHLAKFEEAFVAASQDQASALNVSGPLDSLAETAFEEPSQSTAMEVNTFVAVAAVNVEPVERRIQEVVGESQQNDFAELKASLAAQAVEFAELAKPEPERVRAEPTLVTATPKVEAEPELAAEPELVKAPQKEIAQRNTQKNEIALVSPTGVEAPEVMTDAPAEPELVRPTLLAQAKQAPISMIEEPVKDEPEVIAEVQEPELVRPSPKISEVAKAPRRAVTPSLTPLFASLGSVGPALDTQMAAAEMTNQISPATRVTTIAPVPEPKVAAKDKNVLVAPSPKKEEPQARKVAAPAMELAAPSSIVVHKEREPELVAAATTEAELSERIFGRLELAPEVEEWLGRKRGHIELSLQPDGENDQDPVQLDYQYPNEEFIVEPSGLKGSFNVVAKFFLMGISDPVAVVVNPGVINAETNTRKVNFRLSNEIVKKAIHVPTRAKRSGILYTANLYKVDPATHRRAKPGNMNSVSGGELSIVGFPEWGTANLDSDGILRLPLPAISEVLAKITAPGFYPTYKIISTFASNVHQRIYLVNEYGTDPTIAYFTSRSQVKENEALKKLPTPQAAFGIIMGRIFDASSLARKPLAQQQVEISAPLAAAQLLPATTESGFFGFSHVVPSMRLVQRPGGGPTMLVNVIDGSAQYIELGRGGRRSVMGQLIFGGVPVGSARVRFPGDKKSETWTDELGNFRIDNVDLPSGLLTLEVEAKEFPTTWINVPWDPKQRERKLTVQLLNEATVSHRAKSNTDFKGWISKMGMLAGNVRPLYFRNGNACVYATLLNTDGTPVSEAHGPFPFSGVTRNHDKNHCITKDEPDFAFFNLKDGEYSLKLVNATGMLLRARVVRIGNNRVTISRN